MSITLWLAYGGGAITLLLGLMGLLFPDKAAAFTNMSPVGTTGQSEIRATYGGFFLFLGAAALYFHSNEAFSVLGLAWCGAALGRSFSVMVDKSYEAKNIGGIIFEAAIGLLCLAPLLRVA